MADKKVGRKSKYETDILPHLEKIKSALEGGATVSEIAKALGIAESTIYKYKAEKTEFAELFTRTRQAIVFEIKNALLKKALGYEYEEEKRVGRKDKAGESIVLVEKYKRHSPPSETAAAMLLRNYDKQWLDKDQTSMDLRKQEQDLKKAIAEANNFDLDLGENDDE